MASRDHAPMGGLLGTRTAPKRRKAPAVHAGDIVRVVSEANSPEYKVERVTGRTALLEREDESMFSMPVDRLVVVQSSFLDEAPPHEVLT